jgi:antitoxin PrlF
MKSTVSEKGQVTIPKALREKLGLRPGQTLEFESKKGLLVGRKVTGKRDAVEAVFGILGRGDVDAELERMRGKAWNPAEDKPRANRS